MSKWEPKSEGHSSSGYHSGDCGGAFGAYHGLTTPKMRALTKATPAKKRLVKSPSAPKEGLLKRAGKKVVSAVRGAGKFLGKHKGKIAAGALALGAAHVANKVMKNKYGFGLKTFAHMAGSVAGRKLAKKGMSSFIGKKIGKAVHSTVSGVAKQWAKGQHR